MHKLHPFQFPNDQCIIILNSKITTSLIMQVNQSRKQNKTKQIQQQLQQSTYSVSQTMRPYNPTHCRSLVDLNTVITSSAQKENKNVEHYSSAASNQENKPVNINKCNNNNNGNGTTRQPLVNSKNISNIAKILLNANTSKPKQNVDVSKNNSFIQAVSTPHNISQNGSIKNKIVGSQQKKNDIFTHISANNLLKVEARTSSQAQIRDNNEPHSSLKPNSTQQRYQLSLQKERPEKQLKKQPRKFLQQQRERQLQKKQQNKQFEDYNLILKLKQYIKDLKENEQKHFQHIKQLTQQLTLLKQQSMLFKQKIQGYQIREKQMIKKIKNQQCILHDVKNKQKNNNQHHYHQLKNQCHEHQLIIQSLKNVINQQMTKIIELQTYKVQLQQEKHRSSFSKQDRQYRSKNIEDNHQQIENQDGHQRNLKQFHEIYSFKKRNNLNDESIYIEEQNCNDIQQHFTKIQQTRKSKKSYASIPQPYNELIRSLKSDSRIKNKNIQKQSINQIDAESQDYVQTSNSDEYNQPSQDQGGNVKQKTQCSEDQILQEVGQYLSFIRKNVRDS